MLQQPTATQSECLEHAVLCRAHPEAVPPGTGRRELLVGFGDLIFNEEQAEEAQKDRDQSVQLTPATGSVNASEIRGLTIKRRAALSTRELDSAGIGSLPDTALEPRSIAAASGADPSEALYLETDANEQNVKRSICFAFALWRLPPMACCRGTWTD
jgi:hypothetical protein